jgi:hypothetical protein
MASWAQNDEFGFNPANFNGNFCVKFQSNAHKHFYAVNTAQLASEFEKKFFQNLVFSDNQLAAISTILPNGVLYLSAPVNFTEDEITTKVNLFKTQSQQAANIHPQEQQQIYNQQNNKGN